METMGQRLRGLREEIKISQEKLAKLSKSNQSSVNRYEHDQAAPPLPFLVWYADYFDVSLDYLMGRTNNPPGKLYGHRPRPLRLQDQQTRDLRQFLDMCLYPHSPTHDRLRQVLADLIDREG